MKLSEVLKNYKIHSFGENGEIKELVYEDITIDKFLFSNYELDANCFLEVIFRKCDFTNTYLGSLWICGSTFEDCIFETNTFVKGKAVYAEFLNTKIVNFDIFRTEFSDAVFKYTDIKNSCIDNCDFRNTTFLNCKIENVTFNRIIFDNATFKAVKFVKCNFSLDSFDHIKGLNEIEFIECNFIKHDGKEISLDSEIKSYIRENMLEIN